MAPASTSPVPAKTLESLALLKNSAVPAGVYRFSNHARPDPILASITDWGWYAGYINGKFVNDKQTFLNAAGQALAFPPYYGQNWDAFEEMVRDLNWAAAPGYVLLYDDVHRFAAGQPEQWQTALSILQSATAHWQSEKVPFYVLLRHNWRWNRRLPKLAS